MNRCSGRLLALVAAVLTLSSCGSSAREPVAPPEVVGSGAASGGGSAGIAGGESQGASAAVAPVAAGAAGTGAQAGASGGQPSTPPTLTLPPLTHLPTSLGPRFAGGIEPGDASLCEAAPPGRCYWVDANAPAGGDGTFASPYNSFEKVVGAMQGSDYLQGSIAGGDHLYLRGTFAPPTSDDPAHFLRIALRRASQGGTLESPTVIKSWRGFPRAVFDGQHQTSDLLVFAGLPAFRVTNIEIQNANGRGLVVESGEGLAIFEDLVVHDTIGDGVVGVGGGLHFYGGADQEFVVRNCHFYANNREAFGAINNIGALSLTSDLEGPGFGTLRVYGNVFENETTGVRHKHAGNYTTEIYENLFWNSERAILLRSFRGNEIRSNTFLNLSESAVVSYVENTRGELRAAIHHNNFFNTARLLTDVIGVREHNHLFDVHHNFYQSPAASTAYEISATASLPFVSGSQNLYLMPTDGTFFSDPTAGSALPFAAFSSSIGDATSVFHAATAASDGVSVYNQAYEEYAVGQGADPVGY